MSDKVVHATAREAIVYSEAHGEVAFCDGTATNHEALAKACDGQGGGYDYWGDSPTNDMGMLWRVHTVFGD